MKIMGYQRECGKVGIRNYVLVMATCACSSAVTNQIANDLEGVAALTHGYGCGIGLTDISTNINVLKGVAMNPNVGAVLLVGLGCEVVQANMLAPEIEASGCRVKQLIIQEEGGSQATVAKGRSLAVELARELAAEERVELPLSSLVVGLQCGGSDAFSGVTANPAIGLVSDWLVDQGATTLLAETTEMIGAEHLLISRAVDAKVGKKLAHIVDEVEKKTHAILGPLAANVIAPGNMDGGMSTIMEKSLGCIAKGGSTPVMDVIGYGEVPQKKGLVVMDTPGYDIESMAGLAAGGAQLMLFSTGRGTPAGFPVVPVIKIVSNSVTYEKMKDDIDINAGVVIDGGKTLEEIGDEIISLMCQVAEGKKTRAEVNKQDIFGFLKREYSF